MSVYAMAMAMTATAVANPTGNAPAAQSGDAQGVSFAQLLGAVNGAADASGQTAGTAQGMSWRDIQAGMMMEALETVMSSEKPLVTDPVLAQLMEMLKGLAQGDGELEPGDMGALLKLVEKMQQRLQELLDEKGPEEAGAELMALFANLMPMMGGMQMPKEMAEAAAQNDGGGGLLQMVLQSSPEDVVSLLSGQAAPKADVVTESFAVPQPESGAAAGNEAASLDEMPVVSVESTQQPAGKTIDFEAAIQAAKHKMAETKTEAPAPKLPDVDVDALQQKVDTGLYMRNTAFAGMDVQQAEMPAVPVETQVFEGVLAGMQSGNDQFTITLAPENLGEVTVQLTQTAEGMRLDIIAKNPETQRLLAGEMDALRDNLRPLKVEVDSVITQQQYDMLSQQNFGGQHQQSWQPLKGAAYYGDVPMGEGMAEEAPAPVMAAVTPNTALDAYI